MCGVVFQYIKNGVSYDTKYSIDKTKHRGPNDTTIVSYSNYVFGFHRLSINDVSSVGNQPMYINDNVVMCNGEIYNWIQLKDELKSRISDIDNLLKSNSDCEILGHLFDEYKHSLVEFCNKLDGVFAIVIYNKVTHEVFIARDPIGIRPLYYGFDDDGYISVASEIKSLPSTIIKKSVTHFPPGHYYYNGNFVNYESIKYSSKPTFYPSHIYHTNNIRTFLIEAVRKRLMSDRPIGFFLSGGLDSSIVAAIGKHLNIKLNTFSIGLQEPFASPDIEYADLMSNHLDSNHTVITFTPEDGIRAVKNVIYHLETYDCTTIRASIPMFLLSEYISKNTDIKVILSGEGADELFGGYIYLHNAPSNEEFQRETKSLLKNVHQFDALRADRCTAAHGLELRVPFFDKKFVNYVLRVPPELKKSKIEKQLLRDAFKDLLPKEIYSRQKNGMSDAVGYSWVDTLKQYMCDQISDENYNEGCKKYINSKNIPKSKEEFMYRKIYESMYESVDCCTSGIWRPKWTDETDPSARLLYNFES